jgi:hypothetical protein
MTDQKNNAKTALTLQSLSLLLGLITSLHTLAD